MNRMVLAIDTSINGLRVGLVESGVRSPVWSGTVDDVKGSAARMSSLLDQGLKAIGCDVDQIASVVVSCGPGSFTGIRVGIAFAKGLVAGRHSAAAGCTSIGLYAAAESERLECPVAVLLPATSSAGYLVKAERGQVRDLRGVDISDARDLASAALPDERHIIAGQWPAMAEALAGLGIQSETRELKVVADAACLEMCAVFSREDLAGQKMNLEPLYLRRSSVEEKKGAGGGK